MAASNRPRSQSRNPRVRSASGPATRMYVCMSGQWAPGKNSRIFSRRCSQRTPPGQGRMNAPASSRTPLRIVRPQSWRPLCSRAADASSGPPGSDQAGHTGSRGVSSGPVLRRDPNPRRFGPRGSATLPSMPITTSCPAEFRASTSRSVWLGLVQPGRGVFHSGNRMMNSRVWSISESAEATSSGKPPAPSHRSARSMADLAFFQCLPGSASKGLQPIELPATASRR